MKDTIFCNVIRAQNSQTFNFLVMICISGQKNCGMGKMKQAANFTVETMTLEYDLKFVKQLTGTTTVISCVSNALRTESGKILPLSPGSWSSL